MFEFRNPNLDMTNALCQFTALEILELENNNLKNFESHSALKTLKIHSNHRNVPVNVWFTQNFPQLESISFFLLRNCTNEMIIDTLNLNPQLRCVKIVNCPKLTTAILIDIAQRVPNLEQFSFETWDMSMTYAHMQNLKHLKNLKHLTIVAQFLTDELMHLLVNNEIPIETLAINGNNDNLVNAPTIVRLKSLRIHSVSDENLPKFVEKQPNLKQLFVTNTRELTMNGLKKILEVGKKLEMVSLYVNGFDVNEQSYQSVLALVKCRVILHIMIITGIVTVPSNVIAQNSEWFKLSILRNSPQALS